MSIDLETIEVLPADGDAKPETDKQARADRQARADKQARAEKQPSADKPKKRKKRRVRRKRKPVKNASQVGTRKKKRRIGTILLRLFLLLLLLGGIVGGVLFFLHRSNEAQKEAAAMEQLQAPVKEETVTKEEPEILPDISPDVLGHIVTAGEMVDTVYKQRPPSVDLTEAEAAEFGTITSCVIEEGSRVSVTMEVDGLPVSDDKFYYLFGSILYF